MKLNIFLVIFIFLFPAAVLAQASSSTDINLQVTGETPPPTPATNNNQGGGQIMFFQIKNVIAGNITTDSADISWQTSQFSLCQIFSGKTSEYEQQTISETNYATGHFVKLNNLNSSSNYHFQISCIDKGNEKYQTSDLQFSTLSSVTIPPGSITPIVPAVPLVPTVTPTIPIISQITVNDFKFSANGVNIPVKNQKTIEIQQNSSLNISTNCGKLPGAKNVIINLNGEKTETYNSCSVSLVVPKNPGQYSLQISVVNSKNEIISQINAQLNVLAKNQKNIISFLSIYIFVISAILVLIFGFLANQRKWIRL